jgi:4-diphosphocytidyl-2C-methyl-D-erythritol kinase
MSGSGPTGCAIFASQDAASRAAAAIARAQPSWWVLPAGLGGAA